jgi:hypothetical protein
MSRICDCLWMNVFHPLSSGKPFPVETKHWTPVMGSKSGQLLLTLFDVAL